MDIFLASNWYQTSLDWIEILFVLFLMAIPMILLSWLRFGWLRYRALVITVIAFISLGGGWILLWAGYSVAFGSGHGSGKINELWTGFIPLGLWLFISLACIACSWVLRVRNKQGKTINAPKSQSKKMTFSD